MPTKREAIKRLIWDISLIVFAAVTAMGGKHLSDKAPIMALFFCITALSFLIIGIVELHETISVLESISNRNKR